MEIRKALETRQKYLLSISYAESDRMDSIITILQDLSKLDNSIALPYNPLQYKSLRMLAEDIRAEEEREKYKRNMEEKK